MTAQATWSQGSLLDELRSPRSPRAGTTHRKPRDTELAAALAIVPRSGSQRMRVLEAIVGAGAHGLTDWGLVAITGFLRSTICARRNELVKGGWVEDSGRRRREQTGSKAIVWVATARGRNALERQAS